MICSLFCLLRTHVDYITPATGLVIGNGRTCLDTTTMSLTPAWKTGGNDVMIQLVLRFIYWP